MSTLTLNPAVAAAQIGDDGHATYVDIRPVAEFVTGHPRGRVVNVPIVFHHPGTGEEHPNRKFLVVMEHVFEHDRELVVGGDGPRAAQAVQELVEAGYGKVALMAGGMDGWRALGLPVTGDNRDGVSYVSLLTPAWRAHEKKKK